MPVGFYKPFGMGTRLAKSLSVFPRRRPITKANPVVASGQPVLPSRRYTPHMADWLILLLKYGGFGAVLFLALWIMGGWLLKRINAALDSYTTAYFKQKAAIDARIANLEKLAEEQARLTRTVESIKDEIAAQAKSRDNRWEFRKEVYVNLITATSGLIRAWSGVATNMSEASRLKHEQIPLTDLRMAGVIKRLNSDIDDQVAHGNVFATYVSLSPLAIAEDVVPLVTSTWERFKELDLSSPELIAANMPEKQKTLGELLRTLQAAGRKDLWGTPEPEAKG